MSLLFDLGFMACQDYFTHFEPSQSLGGMKTGDPQEKPPDHPQAEPTARDDEQFRVLKISDLNHLATGAA